VSIQSDEQPKENLLTGREYFLATVVGVVAVQISGMIFSVRWLSRRFHGLLDVGIHDIRKP